MASDDSLPDTLQAKSLIEDGGAHKVGEYRPLKSGDGYGSRIPQPFARMLGVEAAVDGNVDDFDIATWVDLDDRWVILKIPPEEPTDD